MLLDKCLEMCSDELATRYEIATEVVTALENQAVSQALLIGRSREKCYGETHHDLGRQARCDDERTNNRYLHHRIWFECGYAELPGMARTERSPGLHASGRMAGGI